MLKTKHLLSMFLPAILLAAFALFIQVIRYKPLFPEVKQDTSENGQQTLVPMLAGDPLLGDKKAPKTVVIFEDFACEGCKTQDTFLTSLLEQYPGALKVIWKGLPVARFPYDARQAHAYALCAANQGKFVEFKSYAFANNTSLSETILKDITSELGLNEEALATCVVDQTTETRITNTEAIARSLNIQHVPSIFIDNKQIPAPTTIGEWKTILNIQ